MVWMSISKIQRDTQREDEKYVGSLRHYNTVTRMLLCGGTVLLVQRGVSNISEVF